MLQLISEDVHFEHLHYFSFYIIKIKSEVQMKHNHKKIILSGLFIALGFILPFLTGQIPSIGNKLLPMHIPILLCGLICGWEYGLIIGIVVPIFRSLLLGMPPLFPIATSMAFELAVYGMVSGFLYYRLPKNGKNLYVSLITAMISGRIVWGIVNMLLLGVTGSAFTINMFVMSAFINSIPGIIIQLILIPAIMLGLEKSNVLRDVI